MLYLAFALCIGESHFMKRPSKFEYQELLRSAQWGIHMSLSKEICSHFAEDDIRTIIHRTCYRLSKRLLNRRFANFQLHDRFHAIGFFHGRETHERQPHVLFHVPWSVRSSRSRIWKLKAREILNRPWLSCSPPAPVYACIKFIESEAYTRNAATYVSRFAGEKTWGDDISPDIFFSR